jgi:hypothetical protein
MVLKPYTIPFLVNQILTIFTVDFGATRAIPLTSGWIETCAFGLNISDSLKGNCWLG